jgi:hypothetical protein
VRPLLLGEIFGQAPEDLAGHRPLIVVRHRAARLGKHPHQSCPHIEQAGDDGRGAQLALEYAHRHADDYDLVWWVPAESRLLATGSLAELALRLGAPARAGRPGCRGPGEAQRSRWRGTRSYGLVAELPRGGVRVR